MLARTRAAAANSTAHDAIAAEATTARRSCAPIAAAADVR
jgi:hypothetical protein